MEDMNEMLEQEEMNPGCTQRQRCRREGSRPDR